MACIKPNDCTRITFPENFFPEYTTISLCSGWLRSDSQFLSAILLAVWSREDLKSPLSVSYRCFGLRSGCFSLTYIFKPILANELSAWKRVNRTIEVVCLVFPPRWILRHMETAFISNVIIASYTALPKQHIGIFKEKSRQQAIKHDATNVEMLNNVEVSTTHLLTLENVNRSSVTFPGRKLLDKQELKIRMIFWKQIQREKQRE